MGEAVVAHDQGGEAVGKGVDARTRLGMGAFIGPYYIKAGVNTRDGEAVESRMAEREGGQVVCVRQLHGRALVSAR